MTQQARFGLTLTQFVPVRVRLEICICAQLTKNGKVVTAFLPSHSALNFRRKRRIRLSLVKILDQFSEPSVEPDRMVSSIVRYKVVL